MRWRRANRPSASWRAIHKRPRELRPLLETAAGPPALRMEPSKPPNAVASNHGAADLLRRTTPRKALGFLPLATASAAALSPAC
jgi:hypothetical protein